MRMCVAAFHSLSDGLIAIGQFIVGGALAAATVWALGRLRLAPMAAAVVAAIGVAFGAVLGALLR